MSWTDQLEANLVLASAGANFYSAVANQKFPVFSSINSDEQSNFDSLNEKVEELNKMAVRAESFEKLQATKAVKEVTENTPNEIRDYSFQDAMNQAATGRLEGLVKEMDQEARKGSLYWSII